MKAGAQAVKIEGIEGAADVIHHIVQSGVPVMGHLGLTPQSVHQMGGYKVQATEEQSADLLLRQALQVEAAGAFAVVLECVPAKVAAKVTQALAIPTIGIGAGVECGGQVLVFQDMLGLNIDFQPKFVRRYFEGFNLLKEAFDHYDRDVKAAEFPTAKESY
jgi:3-methyl-2-oxobutanoate hydroxymethyltransferase